MNLVVQNPYRILGIVNPISHKELLKAESNLKTFIEFKKPIDFSTDLIEIFPLSRTLESIQDASRQIENDEDKLFYSLFWFYQLDGFDADIVGSIKKHNFNEIIAKLESQLRQNPNIKFSSLINLNVLYFIKLISEGFNNTVIHKIIKNYGQILNFKLEEIKGSLLPSSSNSINNEKVSKKIVENLINYVEEYSNKTNGFVTLNILDAFNNYPKSITQFSEAIILTPLIQKIENAVNVSENLIKQNNSSQLYKKNGLIELESLVRELNKHANNYSIKNAINTYIEAAISCAYFALDKVKDEKTALDTINWALTLPVTGQAKEKLENSKKSIENSIEETKLEQLFAPVLEQLKRPITSIADADYRVEVYKVELRKFTKKDDSYYEVSSLCVQSILNFIHENFVQAGNVFELDRDKVGFLNHISQLLNIVNKLDNFDMNLETRQIINQALTALRETKAQFQNSALTNSIITNTSNQSSAEQKNKAWMVTILIFIAILIMIGVLNSNKKSTYYSEAATQTQDSTTEDTYPSASTVVVESAPNTATVDTSTTLYCPVYNTKGGGYVQLRLSCDTKNCITDESTLGDRINDYSVVQVYPNYIINNQGNGVTIDFIKLADREDTWISSTRLIKDQCSTEPPQTSQETTLTEVSTSDAATQAANTVADSAAAEVAEAAANATKGVNESSSSSSISYTCPVYNTHGGGYVQLRKYCDTRNCITDDSTLGNQIDDYDLVKIDPKVVFNSEGNNQTINFVKLADRADTWISETRIIVSKCVASN